MAHSILIVVPTLDSFRLLPRLVDSLRRQTFDQWRLLFVDGPSGIQHRQWLEDYCSSHPRCSWVGQESSEPGIFGAMNKGFAEAASEDWLLFWGSDDWAAGPSAFEKLSSALQAEVALGITPDLVVCRGRYVHAASGAFVRPTMFQSAGRFTAASYRRALFVGATPPHQATLFGPGARQRLARYVTGFGLSADLDYFLQLSRSSDLVVQCLDLELVHMAAGGISGQQTQRRLQEVRSAYRRAFGWRWWFPFVARYVRRLISLLERNL